MPATLSQPDDFFQAEFGTSDLSARLWRGGLRADDTGYSLVSTPRALTNALGDALDAQLTDGTVERIVSELEAAWNDTSRLRRACSPITAASHHVPAALSLSLVKLVLSIELLQPAVITCIVNKISEFGEDASPDADLASVLLNQLKWLDFVADGAALCESLLSIVPVISPVMQTSLIEALPEILDDAAREPAITELVRILEESPSMMGSVVDALGALGVDEARLVHVNSSILSTLAAANRDILPASLRYLLRTCPQPLLGQTVSTLRSTLALPGLGPGPGRLCLDAVRAGLRMSKSVADHVVSTLRKIEKPSDHKPADLWILIALLDSPMHRKPAEVVFKKKAAGNFFSKALIDAALAPFADAFGSMTERLIGMASLAVRSHEVGARRTGVFLYSLLFRLFSYGNTRRNVVTALLDHTGTRRSHEIDAALEALALIAKKAERDRSLLPHSALIQGLLDFIEHFGDSQLRQIWTVLGYLCRASSVKPDKKSIDAGENNGDGINGDKNHDVTQLEEEDEGESELAMLEILLRKELTHADTFYRRIGVLGACTMIKVLGVRVKNNILNMLLEVGKSHPFSQALAFDELAQVFSEGDPIAKDTAESIRKTVSELFERKYITERAGLGDLTKLGNVLPAALFGNLEGEDVEFCFSISSLIRDERSMKESKDAVRAMVPNLRLLCVMTAGRYDGSLSEVDAVIGAALHLPTLPKEQEITELPSAAAQDLLLSLFIAHGWLVELINAFATQESSEIRAKCVKRLDNLLEITSQMSVCTAKLPLWADAVFDSYHGTRGCTSSHGRLGAKDSGRPKRALKGQRSGQSAAGQNQPLVRAKDWQKFARQLGPSALSLIRITGPITWRFTETESEFVREGNPMTETVTMSPQGLLYLLTELAAQIGNLVGANFKKSGAFGVSLVRSFATSVGKPGEIVSMSEASTDGPLKRFRELKAALTALGPQLSRTFDKIFPIDVGEFTEDDLSIQAYRECATFCLQILAVALNSAILADSAAQGLLFDLLASIRLDGDLPVEPSNPLSATDIHVSAKVAFGQLQKRLDLILGIDPNSSEFDPASGRATNLGFEASAAFLAATDAVLIHCSENDQESLGSKLSKAAYGILEHSWEAATLKSKKTQRIIPGIVKIYVQVSSDPFATAEKLRDVIVKFSTKQIELEKKAIDTQNPNGDGAENEDSLGSLNAFTCFTYTIAILEQYLWLFKSFQPKSFGNVEHAFGRMVSFMKAEVPLYSLARQNQRMLGPVMRAGRTLVDVFLKSCLPFLKEHFKSHRTSVVQLCKLHQKSTRILQSFCAHSKYMRDTSLTGLVPPLRKSLELLLYRVKDLLQSHNATDAFQLGNLKHRDINGEVLNSQDMQYQTDSENKNGSESEDGTEKDDDERDSQRKKKTKPPSGSSGKSANAKLSRLSSSQVIRKKTSAPRGGKDSKANAKKTKKAGNSKVLERRNDLDFGSDGSNGGSDVEMKEDYQPGSNEHALICSLRQSQLEIEKDMDELTKSKKRRRNSICEEEEEEDKVHPLIDNEAEEDSEEEDVEGDDLMSQFVVFGDEEEEE